jgi:dethiobiotin synthetase
MYDGRPDRIIFVTGTGTEVGKTTVSAALLRRWRRAGLSVAARKAAQSGPPGQPTDADILGNASDEPPTAVCPAHRWYSAPFAPPMAAQALGRPPFSIATLVAELRWPGTPVDVGVVEVAGGVRTPQADDGDAIDLGDLLRPDAVVLVAEAGLGTINAVRLSCDALAGVRTRTGQTAPVSVVLNRFDPHSDLHRRNRSWLSDISGMAVSVALAADHQCSTVDGLGRLIGGAGSAQHDPGGLKALAQHLAR